MSEEIATPAPHKPPGSPSDWVDVVRGNYYSNLQRLALWIGGQTEVKIGEDPSQYFRELGEESIGDLVKGAVPTIYVVVHGWAPKYATVVKKNNGKLRWWQSNAKLNDRWFSDWAWAPVGPDTPEKFTVNPTGLFQQIIKQEPSALALAYSWIDDSATSDDNISVYRSEAKTNLNGLRLANALMTAIPRRFFELGVRLHLIGHSHGSKVCTVAALRLQQHRIQTAQLTILDSPESYGSRFLNGANLLGFYLEQMNIKNPSSSSPGTVVENYTSYVGVGYESPDGKSPINNIVEVALYPRQIYGNNSTSAGPSHIYAAGWYGGAASGAKLQGQPPVGLAWPPFPTDYRPAKNQTWPGGGHSQANQWLLNVGPPIIGSSSYVPTPLSVEAKSRSGRVDGDPSTGLMFRGADSSGEGYSIFSGTYKPNNPKQWGIAFDLEWTGPSRGISWL
jgi:hypothetical protein